MTADIDLWVTATILRELRNNGLITQKEAERILSCVAKQTGVMISSACSATANEGL